MGVRNDANLWRASHQNLFTNMGTREAPVPYETILFKKWDLVSLENVESPFFVKKMVSYDGEEKLCFLVSENLLCTRKSVAKAYTDGVAALRSNIQGCFSIQDVLFRVVKLVKTIISL